MAMIEEWLCLTVIITGVVARPNIQFNTVVEHSGGRTKRDVNDAVYMGKLSDTLWNQTSDLAVKTLNTEFLQRMRNGTLDPTAFGAYMVQDAVYCERISESIAIANENLSILMDLKYNEFFIQHSRDYMGYALDLYKEWHIRDSSGIKLGSACKAYTDYQREVATTLDPIYTIVALIPCVKLWPWIGYQLQHAPHNFGLYENWVGYYLDPTYDGYKALDDWVDDWYAKGLIDTKKALDVYRNSMQGELDFFATATD